MTSSGVSWPPLKAQLSLTVLLRVFSGLCEEVPLPAASRAMVYRQLLQRTKREGELVFFRVEPPDKLSNLKWSAPNKCTHEQHKMDSTGHVYVYICILDVCI